MSSRSSAPNLEEQTLADAAVFEKPIAIAVAPLTSTTRHYVWSIRTKLQIEGRARDLALFNLAIDSKL
jgi:hypothetical protein